MYVYLYAVHTYFMHWCCCCCLLYHWQTMSISVLFGCYDEGGPVEEIAWDLGGGGDHCSAPLSPDFRVDRVLHHCQYQSCCCWWWRSPRHHCCCCCCCYVELLLRLLPRRKQCSREEVEVFLRVGRVVDISPAAVCARKGHE